jgi:transcriptional antiterminator NusG
VTDDPNAAIRQPDPTPQADQPGPEDRQPPAPAGSEATQRTGEEGKQREAPPPPVPVAPESASEQVIPPVPKAPSEPAIEQPAVVEPPESAPALGESPLTGEAPAGEIEKEKMEGEGALGPAPIEASPAPAEPPAVEAVEHGEVDATAGLEAETPATAEAVTPAEVPKEPIAEEPKPEEPKSEKMEWYILKVQSNREESIREGLRKKIKIEGKERYFGDVIIPTEKVTEFKGGKRRVFKRKLYPGYLVVQMELNDDTWYLVRDTAGIGDFTGAAGHPTPMQAREVAAILAKQEEKADEAPKLKINFKVGDHVKIKEGTFENFEGEVANIDETNGRVTVLINIFGRSTPVDIEYWQVENV